MTVIDQLPVAVDLTPAAVGTLAQLRAFRQDLLGCFTAHADALFELADAIACTPGRISSPVELCLQPEFRRGHGSLYAALNQGGIDAAALRRLLVGQVAPARPGQPLMFAIDTTPLPRPDATYAEDRTMVQVRSKGPDAFLPGLNYSTLVGISWGASSWVNAVEARRVTPPTTTPS